MGDTADVFASAVAHREAGRYAEAVAWLSEYLARHPDDPQALGHLCHVQLLRRQDAAAQAALERAEARAPNSLLVLRNRARLALKAGKIDAAGAAIGCAFAIDAADRDNRLIWSAVLAARGDASGALQILNAPLGEDADFAEALLNRALLHMRGQNLAAATLDASRATDMLQWEHVPAHYHRGNALRENAPV